MSKKVTENRGFSLIELAVTVMIMSVLAVAFAPQVMRWVNNSRVSSDLQTKSSVTSFAQLAMTDIDAYTEAQGKYITIEVTNDGCFIDAKQGEGNGALTVTTPNVAAAFAAAAGETSTANGTGFKISNIKTKASGAELWVVISSSKIEAGANNILVSDDMGIDSSILNPSMLTNVAGAQTSTSVTVGSTGAPVSHSSNKGAGATAPRRTQTPTLTQEDGNFYISGNLVVHTVNDMLNLQVSAADAPLWVYIEASDNEADKVKDGHIPTSLILYKWDGATDADGHPIWIKQHSNGLT